MQIREDEQGRPKGEKNNTVGSIVGQDEEEYSVDTELDGEVNGHQRSQPRCSRHVTGMCPPRREVRADDSLGKIKFTKPSFDGKYNPDAYLTWELAVDQKFICHDFPEDKCFRAATSEFTNLASVCWSEYTQNWDALKRIMRARFVP